MTVPDIQVRPAANTDLPRIADTLAAAFADYPFTRHTIAADDHVERIRRTQKLFVAEIGLVHGRVWVADDADAVAVWTTPDFVTAPKVFAGLAARLEELAGDRSRQATAAEAVMRPHRPAEPVWFLGSVGVLPRRQGQGLGRSVIAPGLAAADEAEVPAFLETSTPANVEFYRRLGFEVTAEVKLPDDGPLTWAMLRPVRG